MRFVPEGEEKHTLLTSNPSLTVANRVKEIADLVERELIEDDVSKNRLLNFVLEGVDLNSYDKGSTCGGIFIEVHV